MTRSSCFVYLFFLLALPGLAFAADKGALREATFATTCDAVAEGSVRYDTTGNQLQLCDGASWVTLGASPCAAL